jgi:uncharacterized protein (DUF427 family)
MSGSTDPVLVEESPRRVRVELACETVADSARVLLYLEPGRSPTYLFPVEDAAGSVPELSGFVAFRWDAMDAWYEEDVHVLGGVRNPYHRVDAIWSTRHVTVGLAGEVIAESHAPCLVFETGLPARYYLPRSDVRMDLLSPSQTRSVCQYKGVASYLSATVSGETHADVAWTYETPLAEQPKLARLVCFYPERVDAIEVDGEPAASLDGRP